MGRLTQAWAIDRAGFDDQSWMPGFIERKQREQALKRRRASVALLKHYRGLYDCCQCIHGLTASCVDHLPDGCEHFADEIAGRVFEDTLHKQVKKRYIRPRKRKQRRRND